MKKRTCFIFLGMLLLVLLCFLYIEFRFGTTTVVSQSVSPERILKEMPDIAVTSEEMSMAKALSQTREMEDAFLQAEISENEFLEFPMTDAESLLQAYIPQGWDVLELTVLPKNAYLGFSKGEKRSRLLCLRSRGGNSRKDHRCLWEGPLWKSYREGHLLLPKRSDHQIDRETPLV